MTELTPPGSNARMTKAQMRKYIADMKTAQETAKQKIQEAEKNGDLETPPEELSALEKALEQEYS